MARLAAYIRVSSDGQKDNTSLECQRDQIEAYCKVFGHEIVAICWDVDSAGHNNRKGLHTALRALKYCDGMICAKLDRFARSALDGLRLAADLREDKKQLCILDLNLDTTTAVGECVFTMLLAFAQFERRTIKDRSQAGKNKVREIGGYVEGNPGYGYVSVEAPDNRNCKVRIPHPEEQAWISKMVAWKALGWSYKRIARELNLLAVPSKRGAQWSDMTVRGIIQRHEPRNPTEQYGTHTA